MRTPTPPTLSTLHTLENAKLTGLLDALLALPAGSSFPKGSALFSLATSLRHETGMPFKQAEKTIRTTLSEQAMRRLISNTHAKAMLIPLHDQEQPDTLIDVLVEPEAHAIVISTRIAGKGQAETLLLECYDGQMQMRIMPDPNAEPRKVIPLHFSTATSRSA